MNKKYYEKPVLTLQNFTDEVNTAGLLSTSGTINYPYGSSEKDFEKEERF